MPACHITITHNLQGPSNTLTAESGGAASAIEESIRVIQRGTADVMFCGGAECRIYGQGLLRYYFRGALKNGSQKETAYCIFSPDSSGLVMGEGGTILILEEFEHALARNVPIYAEVKGFFASADSGHAVPGMQATDLAAESQVYTMASALKTSGVKPTEVDSLHLSAKGIREEDLAEAKALQKVFQTNHAKPKLVSTKGLTGFLGYAAAPTEIALAALSLHEKVRVPSLVGDEVLLKDEFSVSRSYETDAKQSCVLVNHFEKSFMNHTFVLGPARGDA